MVVLVGFSLLFTWVFARPLIQHTFPSSTDLFDYYLPAFLSPSLVWSSYEYGGTPVFADPEGAQYYPLRLFFSHVVHSWTAFLISGYVVAACALYAYVLEHTRSRSASLVAALAFALSEAMMERLPHPTIVHAIAWVPLILLAIDRVHQPGRRWLWAAIGALATANCLLAGHPQLPVYSAYACGGYAVWVGISQRYDRRAWLAIAVIAGSGALLASPNLLPLAEVSRYAVRQTVTFGDFVSYANSLPQMLSIAFPRLAHPGLESPTYVGLATVMLAPLAIAQARRNCRIGYWTVVLVVALMLGVGSATPFATLAYDLPIYNRFRIVSRHLVFAALGWSVLAGFAVARVQQGGVRVRTLLLSLLPALALVLAGGLAIDHWPDLFPVDSSADAGALFVGGAGVVGQLIVGVAAVGAIAVFWRWRSAAALVLLTAVLTADLLMALPWRITPAGVQFETVPIEAQRPSVHVERLRGWLAPAGQRLLTPGGARGNDVIVGPWARVWRLPLAGGYSSVELRNMATLLPRAGSGRLDTASLAHDDVVLDVLAVKYVLIPVGAEDEGLLQADPDRFRPVDRFSTALTTDRGGDQQGPDEIEYVVYENTRAQPRAWMAGEVVPVSDGAMEDAIRASRRSDGARFDPAATALVLEGTTSGRLFGDGPRSARVESVQDSAIRVRTSSVTGGFVVLSESYYPGWQARVDSGPLQPVVAVDEALQGIEVPAGDHLVTFEFASPSRTAGIALSISGVLTVLSCGVAALRGRSS
jgi:hypothetical protein